MSVDGTQLCEGRCDIAAYLDGELSADREVEIELHFAGCSACGEELNLQKSLLRHLDVELKDGADIDLPRDFAKVVTANAESTVAGLRRSRERFNALFICGALGLFVLLSFGIGAGTSLFFEQVAAVAVFLGHFVYDVCLGIVVILRTAAAHFRADVLSTFLVGGAAVAVLFVFRKLLAGRVRI
jgi:anti-sigma factor RsiW